jgi:hypothetical protein
VQKASKMKHGILEAAVIVEGLIWHLSWKGDKVERNTLDDDVCKLAGKLLQLCSPLPVSLVAQITPAVSIQYY